MEHLHPQVKWAWRFMGYIACTFLSGFFLFPGLIVTFALTESLIIGGILFLLYPIIMIGFVEIIVQMSYNRWLYELNAEGLKIERGIIWKRYSHIPYQRIQNVDIHRGIFARMFGYSTIHSQTAGYSGQQAHAEGTIPAVDIKKAEEIRDSIMKKITKRG